ncbi:MocR-like pyridoxine biosynthesis transcription factor PdxR [Alkalimarinus alittae]|uniref:PLP-dependent aminotransferase family protein n=1 Tax=Alkalimarinus alittae TaxID=2961619 RepID=A0ABY6MZX1_9ALTE|nr:PLP-dependent aminotransferase family protein [Alkalimarinus alittae]UZE95335.1 PLP-dependent aminotransferase family protein [Alkalimarinus alittae]
MEAPSFSSFAFCADRPLQEQLQQQLTDWIYTGRLSPGTRLPSSRRLAAELNISRNTVTIVLDQLKSEGFLEGIQGKGVFVAPDLPTDISGPSKVNWGHKGPLPELSEFGVYLNKTPLTEHGKILPFTPGIPDIASFPQKSWLQIQRRHQSRINLMGYDGNQGYGPLREALSEYLKLSRGVRCTPQQIIITQGAQQAISLCAQVLLNEGDSVLVENPGYMGARKAFLARRAKLISCPMGENGIDLDALQKNKNINARQPKLMYVTPTHQYPLGGILPASQRLKLLDWASQQHTWLIEDDYDSEFHYFHKPIAALQGMAEETPVIYMGSFSKTLFPALRLGYLVVPEPLAKVFIKAKSFMGGESPLLTQAVVADFIGEGHFIRHLRKMRLLYQDKWQHLNSLLNNELSEQVRPILQSAGMHLAIEIPNIDDQTLKQLFQQQGFGSSALSSYFNENPTMTGLVLGFANTTEHQREQGVAALKKILDIEDMRSI